MKTITLRGVPDELHEQLKIRAKKNGRSVNKQVIEELSRVGSAEHSEGIPERPKTVSEEFLDLVDDLSNSKLHSEPLDEKDYFQQHKS